MLNLLPQEEKKSFITMYRLRIAVIVSLFTSALLIIACVGLLPSYLNEKTQTEVLIKQKQEAEARNTSVSLIESDNKIAKNKGLVGFLTSRHASMAKGDSLSAAILKIQEKKTSAITISSLSFDGSKITIAGVAATRSDLIAFNSSLQQQRYFTSVALPISDIAKSTDADFTIQLEMP